MSPQTPADVHLMWLEAINADDLDAIVSLYEPDSSIVNPDGQLLQNLDAIRTVTTGLLQLKPTFELRVARVLECGDVALLLSPWKMTGTVDGNQISLQGTTTDLVRRQNDGTWRFVIDNPTGIGILGTHA
jgi:uncharacterized protein (TIGR02246 family)